MMRQEMRKSKLDARVRTGLVMEYLTQEQPDSVRRSALDSPEAYHFHKQCMAKLKERSGAGDPESVPGTGT